MYYTARDGTRWASKPVSGVCTSACNVPHVGFGKATNAGDLHSPEDAFSLFVTDKLLHEIAGCNNAEGRQKAQSREQEYKDISVIELKACLDVLIIVAQETTTKLKFMKSSARNMAFLMLKHPSQETGSKQYTLISDLMMKT